MMPLGRPVLPPGVNYKVRIKHSLQDTSYREIKRARVLITYKYKMKRKIYFEKKVSFVI